MLGNIGAKTPVKKAAAQILIGLLLFYLPPWGIRGQFIETPICFNLCFRFRCFHQAHQNSGYH